MRAARGSGRETADGEEAGTLAQRQVRALERIAQSLEEMKRHTSDLSLWLAEIGRSRPNVRDR